MQCSTPAQTQNIYEFTYIFIWETTTFQIFSFMNFRVFLYISMFSLCNQISTSMLSQLHEFSPCRHLNIRSLQSLTPILYPQGSSFYSSLTTLSSGSREVLKEAFEHPGPSSPGTNPISREMHHLQKPKLSQNRAFVFSHLCPSNRLQIVHLHDYYLAHNHSTCKKTLLLILPFKTSKGWSTNLKYKC